MRIITGLARGKKLAAAPGLATRPTTGRVKESIFNIIQFDIEGRAALDLFCGSGQMGLEAVSRGAKSCVFVESDARALDAIRANIRACGFESACRVEARDALAFLSRVPAQSFGLIFLDPPYAGPVLAKALDAIMQFDILAQGGIIVCESARDSALPSPASPYILKREYFYGNTKIATFTRE